MTSIWGSQVQSCLQASNNTGIVNIMVNGIRANDAPGLNKGRGSKFCVCSRVRQETTEEGRRTYRPKHCEYKDEDSSLKTLNDKKNNYIYILIRFIDVYQ